MSANYYSVSTLLREQNLTSKFTAFQDQCHQLTVFGSGEG